MEVLNELLIERCEMLFVSIEKLSRFPPLPQFDNFRDTCLQIQETQADDASLSKDIEQFLKAVDYSSHCSYRVENLIYLREQVRRVAVFRSKKRAFELPT